MTDLIDAAHLVKSFGDTHAVADLSLKVASGEIYGLVGPDGAGKTTTLRMLCGALKTGSGQISIGGYDIAHQIEQARAQVGYLAQRFALYEELTVLENLRFFAEARGLQTAEWKPRCMEILGFVGLAEFINRRAGQLSGGMKQKLGLAAALVHRPRVLLLDEPTTGVDPVTRQDFWQLIIRLASPSPLASLATGEGKTENYPPVAVLVTTPYMDEASRCHRVGFMRSGKLLVEGSPAELRARLNGRIVELRGKPLSLLKQLARSDVEVEDVQMFGDRLHLRVKTGAADAVIQRLRQQISSQGGSLGLMRAIAPQLEDIFISLIEKGN